MKPLVRASRRLVVGLLFAACAASAQMLDLNSADAQALQGLKGIGPVKAQAIVDYRTQHGPFKSVDELAKVPGIKAALVSANRDQLSVGDAAETPPAKPATKPAATPAPAKR